MLGVIVNTFAVIVGGLIGLFFKKGIPEHVNHGVMTALGLSVVYVAITGMLEGSNTLVLILSMILGTITGTILDIDGALNRLGAAIEQKMQKNGETGTIARGFVTASLLFCVGAMAVVGSLNSGLRGDHATLFSKSLLDGFAAIMLASSLGVGVLLSAVSVLVYQGAIVLLAQFIAPVLTEAAIAEMTCAGSVMILAISLNMIGATKLKVANYLPALIFVPLLLKPVEWLMALL